MECPICRSSSIEKQAKFRAAHICFINLERVKCIDCGLHFAHPMPATQELDRYNSSYHESAHGGSERNEKQKAFFKGLAKTRLKYILDNIPSENLKTSKVLEIGPGPGAFVEIWKEKFPQSKYYALESDKSCHQSLIDLEVNILEEKDFSNLNLKFDVLVLSHVLEHVTDPVDFLTSFTHKLNFGGHVFIEIPCMDWVHKNLDEPHLLFFDKPAMNKLLERLQLKKISIAYFGILISDLLNPVKKLLKRLRSFLWRNGITYFHPEKRTLFNILNDKTQTEAVINFYPHKEQNSHAWWLRVVAKKE